MDEKNDDELLCAALQSAEQSIIGIKCAVNCQKVEESSIHCFGMGVDKRDSETKTKQVAENPEPHGMIKKLKSTHLISFVDLFLYSTLSILLF